jgi:hypothetical protein
MQRHWHLTGGSAPGVIYWEKQYDDALTSIDDFLRVVRGVFPKFQQYNPDLTRDMLYSSALDGEEVTIFIGRETPVMVFWTICDSNCMVQTRN